MNTPVNSDDSSTGLSISTTAEWDDDTENTPVYAVVSAVAEASGLDILELPPLYEAINPDALNELFTSRSESAIPEVTFQYAGYDVVVSGSGEVQVQTTIDG